MISANFLNNVENYLNPGVAGSGVPLVSKIPQTTINSSGVTVSHHLVDQNGSAITPDLVLIGFCNQQTTVHICSVDHTTLTSTTVKLYADTTIDVWGIALKF